MRRAPSRPGRSSNLQEVTLQYIMNDAGMGSYTLLTSCTSIPLFFVKVDIIEQQQQYYFKILEPYNLAAAAARTSPSRLGFAPKSSANPPYLLQVYIVRCMELLF